MAPAGLDGFFRDTLIRLHAAKAASLESKRPRDCPPNMDGVQIITPHLAKLAVMRFPRAVAGLNTRECPPTGVIQDVRQTENWKLAR